AGVPPHRRSSSACWYPAPGAATASYTFYRRKLFHPGKWRNGLLATAIGAAIGAWAAHLLPAEWLNRMLPVVVFTCGLYM
ncbi:TSUP family transporter, partial [Pseudomonas aeruginosa]